MKNALFKCATGFSTSEVVEEFAVDGDELKLVKKKITKKEIPPDIKAVQLLMVGEDALTDEELEAEKENLLKLLKGEMKIE